ncbi:MAG: hypothetical protein ABI435_09725 [Pseudolysinimonas sp.]
MANFEALSPVLLTTKPIATLSRTIVRAFGNPAAIAALILPSAPVALAAQLVPWFLPANTSALQNGALVIIAAPAWFRVTSLVLLALWGAAVVFGALGASWAVISDIVVGVRNAPRAWGDVARRAGSWIVVVVVLAILAAVVATIAFAAAWFVSPWLSAVLVAAALIGLAPVLTAPAMALIAGEGPLAAFRDAFAVLSWSSDSGVARARLIAAAVLGAGIPLATLWLTRDLDGSELIVLLRDALRAAALAAGLLLAVAWTTTIALEARVIRHRPVAVPPGRSSSAAPITVAMVAVAALLIPPAASALVSRIDPTGLARVTVVEAGGHWKDIDAAAFGDGLLILSRLGSDGGVLSVCADRQCADYDAVNWGGESIVTLDDGSVVWVHVQAVYRASSNDITRVELAATRLQPSDLTNAETPTKSGDVLKIGIGETPLGETSVIWGEDVPEDRLNNSDVWVETVAAVALDSDGLPVVAVVTRAERDYGTLRVFRCVDLSCSASNQVADVKVLWQFPYAHANLARLDVVALADGTIGVAVIQQHTGPAPLQYVAIPVVGDPVTQVLDDQPYRDEDRDGTAGVRAGVNADGTATFAYRPMGSDNGSILTCGDPMCSTHTSQPMLPSGTAPYLPSPTLAIDDTGRPMYLQRAETGEVLLVSCLDVACVDTETTALTMPEYRGGPIALTLTTDGRPVIVAAAPRIDPVRIRRVVEQTQVLECVEARCGLH